MLIAFLIAAYSYLTHATPQKAPPTVLLSAVPTDAPEPVKNSPTPIPNLGMPEIIPAVLAAATIAPTPTNTPEITTTITSTPQPTITSTPKPTHLPTHSPTATSSASPTPSASTSPSPSPTPSDTPQPTTKPVTKAELDQLFAQYADQYKVDKDQLKRIAVCESGLNTNAKNLYYGGLFQFSEASWKAYRHLMGKRTDPDLRYDPEAAINTAAYLLSTGRAAAWPNCK